MSSFFCLRLCSDGICSEVSGEPGPRVLALRCRVGAIKGIVAVPSKEAEATWRLGAGICICYSHITGEDKQQLAGSCPHPHILGSPPSTFLGHQRALHSALFRSWSVNQPSILTPLALHRGDNRFRRPPEHLPGVDTPCPDHGSSVSRGSARDHKTKSYHQPRCWARSGRNLTEGCSTIQ